VTADSIASAPIFLPMEFQFATPGSFVFLAETVRLDIAETDKSNLWS